MLVNTKPAPELVGAYSKVVSGRIIMRFVSRNPLKIAEQKIGRKQASQNVSDAAIRPAASAKYSLITEIPRTGQAFKIQGLCARCVGASPYPNKDRRKSSSGSVDSDADVGSDTAETMAHSRLVKCRPAA